MFLAQKMNITHCKLAVKHPKLEEKKKRIECKNRNNVNNKPVDNARSSEANCQDPLFLIYQQQFIIS